MSPPWRSLRAQLAVVGFLAIYVPVLLLFGVTVVSESQVEVRDGGTVVETSHGRSAWAPWTVVLLGPAAAGLAWWWSGRAVRPLDRVRTVAADIEATDLDRRIGPGRGPTEVVALAGAFDAMLDRLEAAARTQSRLIEEASHELRMPLAVLVTNAEVLLAHPEPTLDLYRRGLERTRAAATRLGATVEELVVDARGRARTLDRRPADLVAVVRDVVAQSEVLAARSDVALVLRAPPELACRIDEDAVARAVANLVANAVAHGPAGSTVEVEVEVEAGPETSARVSVTDHGPGIGPAEQAHVFERFWRGRPDTRGTGLGLPIARQVALGHGGDVTVRSPGPTGDGAVFTLTLGR